MLHIFCTQSCHSLCCWCATDCGIMRCGRVGVTLWWLNKAKSDLCAPLPHTRTFTHIHTLTTMGLKGFWSACILICCKPHSYRHTFGEILCARRVDVATITLWRNMKYSKCLCYTAIVMTTLPPQLLFAPVATVSMSLRSLSSKRCTTQSRRKQALIPQQFAMKSCWTFIRIDVLLLLWCIKAAWVWRLVLARSASQLSDTFPCTNYRHLHMHVCVCVCAVSCWLQLVLLQLYAAHCLPLFTLPPPLLLLFSRFASTIYPTPIDSIHSLFISCYQSGCYFSMPLAPVCLSFSSTFVAVLFRFLLCTFIFVWLFFATHLCLIA